jgi:hypothetical protein
LTYWLTRPLFNVPRKWARVFLAAAFIAALLLPISPAIYTLGWHLIHGNAIGTGSHRLVVPLRWTAHADRVEGVSMTKYAPTVLHGVRITALISIGPVSSRPGQKQPHDYGLWEKAYSRRALPGEVVEGPIRIDSAGREVLCMESTLPKEPHYSISCLMLQGTWAADFFGTKNDAQTFFTIVRNFK